jgi:hypothetical protein
MKKIFVISWFFPPINSSEGLVTFKLLKNSEYEYVVFTQRENSSWSYGSNNPDLISPNIHCVYSPEKTFKKWIAEGIEYFKANSDDFDVIMSRSMPPESHILALKIHELFPEKKWIASFGDPIARMPYTTMQRGHVSPFRWNPKEVSVKNLIWLFSPKRFINGFVWYFKYRLPVKQLELKENNLESKVINKADKLIFNNKEEEDYILKNYPLEIANKACVLLHPFDENLYPQNKNIRKNIMTYIGHLDYIRTPRPLLEAIVKLKERDNKLHDLLQVEFYGNMTTQDKIFILDNDLTDIVHIKGNIGYLESLKIMKSSDWLLHIDGKFNSILDTNIFFAAKLADYIGSGNKIFGITMTKGTSADILRAYGAITCSHSVDEIFDFLYLILYKGLTPVLQSKYAQNFNAKKVSKQFDSLVKDLI